MKEDKFKRHIYVLIVRGLENSKMLIEIQWFILVRFLLVLKLAKSEMFCLFGDNGNL